MTIIGHQGAPQFEAPESYSSFKRAKEQGADGIEFDLSTTKDGYNVVIHGPDIGRTKCTASEGKKNVADFTLKELKDHCVLYNGEPILTYPELLAKTQGWFNYYFTDIKVYDPAQTNQQFQDIFQAVKELGVQDKVILSTYDPAGNILLREEGKHFTIALDTYTPQDYMLMKDNPYKYFMLPFTSMRGPIVAAVRRMKKDVVTYTVDTPEDMDKVYAMGIRIILTDNIPMVINRMKERK